MPIKVLFNYVSNHTVLQKDKHVHIEPEMHGGPGVVAIYNDSTFHRYFINSTRNFRAFGQTCQQVLNELGFSQPQMQAIGMEVIQVLLNGKTLTLNEKGAVRLLYEREVVELHLTHLLGRTYRERFRQTLRNPGMEHGFQNPFREPLEWTLRDRDGEDTFRLNAGEAI